MRFHTFLGSISLQTIDKLCMTKMHDNLIHANLKAYELKEYNNRFAHALFHETF